MVSAVETVVCLASRSRSSSSLQFRSWAHLCDGNHFLHPRRSIETPDNMVRSFHRKVGGEPCARKRVKGVSASCYSVCSELSQFSWQRFQLRTRKEATWPRPRRIPGLLHCNSTHLPWVWRCVEVSRFPPAPEVMLRDRV